MGLVQVKNFVVPFTNKVHLGTILLVALIFAVYRLSGGGAEIVHSSSRPASIALPSIEPDPEAEALYRRESEQRFGVARGEATDRRASPPRPRGNLLDEAFRSRSEAQKPASSPSAPSGRRGLDDIEKQLGLK